VRRQNTARLLRALASIAYMKGFDNMKNVFATLALSLCLLPGCATLHHSGNESTGAKSNIAPADAVIRAANAAPDGVRGEFSFVVQGKGRELSRSFLNSQQDYRDQRNLTVVLSPEAHRQLRERLRADPLEALIGKEIIVRGEAIRTKIDFIVHGQPTGHYYYQTHVNVADSAQISVQ